MRGLREAARHALFLSPGLADAALSSLAGFAVSLYAVRSLDGPALGAYSLYLAAYVVGSLFAQHLLFLPAQIAALQAPRDSRTAILRPTLRRGAVLSAVVAPVVGGAGALLGDEVDSSTLLALGAGAAALSIVTPLQDHIRSTLHLSGRHVRAALVSGAQLCFTVLALGALLAAGVAEPWVPFTSLALGTAASGAFGLMLAGRGGGAGFVLPPVRSLVRPGMALLPAALVQEAAIFVSAALLASLASAAALGSAEAARIVSRPMQAFSLGISRTLAPRLMEAGESRSRSRARRAVSLYVAATLAAGLLYLAVAGWSYPESPFVSVVPAAYAEEGLVALFLVATLAGAITQVPRGVLLGASESTQILVITVAAAITRVFVVVALAASLEAYALPLAHLASLAIGGGLGARATLRILQRP